MYTLPLKKILLIPWQVTENPPQICFGKNVTGLGPGSGTTGRPPFGGPPLPHPALAVPPLRPPQPTPRSLFIIVMSRAACAFSNRSDEDDLPPELAEAVGLPLTTTPTTTTTTTTTTQVSAPLASPKVHKLSSPQDSESKSQLSPGAKVWGRKALRNSCTCWDLGRN